MQLAFMYIKYYMEKIQLIQALFSTNIRMCWRTHLTQERYILKVTNINNAHADSCIRAETNLYFYYHNQILPASISYPITHPCTHSLSYIHLKVNTNINPSQWRDILNIHIFQNKHLPLKQNKKIIQLHTEIWLKRGWKLYNQCQYNSFIWNI